MADGDRDSGDRERLSARVESIDAATRERVLRILLVTFIALTAVIGVIGFTWGHPREGLFSLVGCGVYTLLLLALPRLGARRCAYLVTAWYFLLAFGVIATGQGIYDISMVLVPAGFFMAALLLPRGRLIPLIGLTMLAVAGLGLARIKAGVTFEDPVTPAADVLVAALLLLVSGVLTHLVVRNLRELLDKRWRAQEHARKSASELAAHNEALALVNDLAHRLHQRLDLEAIARETVSVLMRHSEPPRVAFYLLEDGGERLRLVADHGFSEEERFRGATLPVEGSLSGVAVREKRVAVSTDIAGDQRLHAPIGEALARHGATSALCVPLAFGDSILGTVNLIYGDRRTFTALDLDTFQAIARVASVAVTNARHVASLEQLASHDTLTGLPNRRSLHARFPALLEARGNGQRIGLVLLDLNRFRFINDALGHALGDELLVAIAARLDAGLEHRRHEVFRLGGDEFAVLLPGLATPESGQRMAGMLLASLLRPFEVGGMSLEVGASAGVAVYPDDGSDSHELLRCADVALYRAKTIAGSVAGYRRELDQHTPERLALLSELSRAVREGGLVLYYQPQVALASGAVVGFEALVRWPHSRMGLLVPADFLALAETSDVIHPLTYWVVEQALEQLREWHALRPALRMSINLSMRNLLDRHCSERLEEIFRLVGVDPANVEFELTETTLITDPEAALPILGRISATGARLAIDDFGTGYSSLAYLRRFPVQTIKIDRSFVSEVTKIPHCRAIVVSTVQLARSLGLNVVAEGVEDWATADLLRDIGCDLAQGYYFSHPAPASEIAHTLTLR